MDGLKSKLGGLDASQYFAECRGFALPLGHADDQRLSGRLARLEARDLTQVHSQLLHCFG